jgi:glycosyltransferase involved in cell wall biosynthesis
MSLEPTHNSMEATERDVALVHDYLLVMRGAERSFAAIAGCWPRAPIYTLLFDEQATGEQFAGHPVTTSPLQRLGVRQGGFRRLLPLFPRAVERLDLRDARVVVSSSSAFAHGVRPSKDAVHVCYCYTPFRYAWHERDRAVAEFPGPLRPVGRRLLKRIRRWDLEASRRVTRYVAISELTRERIQDIYGRDSTVIHPPVDVDRFAPADDVGDHFLIVCELVRHKNVDVALAAAERVGAHVKVVGGGPELEALRRRYGGRTAEFLGRADDEKLAELYAGARALIMPSVEEFGIVAVEAMAAGRPVLAAAAGGALETVVDGETGVLTAPRDAEELADAMRSTDWARFDTTAIRRQAERFSTQTFQRRLRAEVQRVSELG